MEVLSRTWGLYFNASPTDYGSADIQGLIDDALEHSTANKDPLSNTAVVRRLAFGLLYARLWILDYCLGISGCEGTFTPQRWMLLQVATPVFIDVFGILSDKIMPLLRKLLPPPSDVVELKLVVSSLFQKIQNQLLLRPRFSPLERSRFIVVMDEVQVLSRHPSGTICLDSDSATPRPILAPIFHSFRRISSMYKGGQCRTCVMACGTGLSNYDLEWAAGAASGIKLTAKEFWNKTENKTENSTIVDFPGWVHEEAVDQYLDRLCQAVDLKSKNRLLELFPKPVIVRLFLDLRGRFRPIISAMEDIIEADDPKLSEICIAQRLDRLTTADLDEYNGEKTYGGNLCAELQRFMSLIEANPKSYPESEHISNTLKFATATYITSGGTTAFQGRRLDLVDAAFDRIKKCAGKGYTVIDEPFALRAADNFFQKKDPGYLHHQSNVITSLDDCSSGRYWESTVPINLVSIFHGRVLPKELFSGPPPHEMFMNKAAIVGRDNVTQGIRHGDISLEEFMEAHFFHDSIHDKRRVPPFFFPKQRESGPDIVFVLRLKDPDSEKTGIICPVFVQLKLRKGLCLSDAEHARSTAQPTKIENHGIALSRYCDPHHHYISLIIGYPTQVTKFFNREQMVVTHSKDTTEIALIVDCHNIRSLFSKEYVDMLDTVKRLYEEDVEPEETARKRRRPNSRK
ncbi:hypothetical protein BGX31_011660 [Mortierella sp. GBA43]|nr:hypothetical protein BGX31_011660 [Mortierella sp. GBA43]